MRVTASTGRRLPGPGGTPEASVVVIEAGRHARRNGVKDSGSRGGRRRADVTEQPEAFLQLAALWLARASDDEVRALAALVRAELQRRALAE